MSNKLYTEEEILSLLKIHLADEDQAESFLALLTPIELPSDEEIEEMGHKHQLGGYEWQNEKRKSFTEGAKWMRHKIQGGNK
jgi:hypothetical protein